MSTTTAETRKCATCNKTEGEEAKLLNLARCRNTKYCSRACQESAWPDHKQTCKPQNYILEVELDPANINDPLQDAAQFSDGPKPDFGPRQNLLRIVEGGSQGSSFDRGAIDMMHNADWVHCQTPEVGSSKIKLSKIFENREYRDSPIDYEYDFGDAWEHKVTVTGRADATKHFVCLDGEGHGVAEDVGSVRGWEGLKKAYRTSNPTKDQKEKRTWFETQASNADSKGLGNGGDKRWDKVEINSKLKRL